MVIWIFVKGEPNTDLNDFQYLYTISKDVITGIFTLIAAIIATETLSTWKKQIKKEHDYFLYTKTMKLIAELKYFFIEVSRLFSYRKENDGDLLIQIKLRGNNLEPLKKLEEKYFEAEGLLPDIQLSWDTDIVDKFYSFVLLCKLMLKYTQHLNRECNLKGNNLLIDLSKKDDSYTEAICFVHNNSFDKDRLFENLEYFEFNRNMVTIDLIISSIHDYLKSTVLEKEISKNF